MPYLASGLITLGIAFVLGGLLGLVRFPDLYTRLHAATVVDTMGFGLILIGLILLAPGAATVGRLLVLGLLLWLINPLVSHIVSRIAFESGICPTQGTQRREGK